MSEGSCQRIARERRAAVKRSAVDSLPVMIGYVTMGFAAGVLFSAKIDVPCAALFSALLAASCLSGTLSFAIVPPIASSAGLGEIALLTLAINFRYALYGVPMVDRWRGVPLLRKWFLIHALSDEIFALNVSCRIRRPETNVLYCTCNGVFCLAYWVAGSTLGAMAGKALPIPSKGIEFAMTALFMVIFTEQMKGLFLKNG